MRAFPQLGFFQFVVGHLGVVIAVLYLVVGLRLVPRPGSVPRVFAIMAGYAAFVGAFDWLTGSNYMFLAAPPENPSLLSVLAPWPWYLFTATAVAFALLVVLDLPFLLERRAPTQRGPEQSDAATATPPRRPLNRRFRTDTAGQDEASTRAPHRVPRSNEHETGRRTSLAQARAART